MRYAIRRQFGAEILAVYYMVMGKPGKLQRGFTLIELLVVIAIIGLLATVVLSSVRVARIRAQVGRVRADARSILTQINLTRSTNLMAVTGNACSVCGFNNSASVKSQASALATLNSSWRSIGFNTAPVDSWGDPYLLDENEGELSNELCRYDIVYSAGPNGIWEGFGTFNLMTMVPGTVISSGSGDDYAFAVDFGSCPQPN